MQPEQHQRIMGYFIEEAKDHLTTLEQGLLNLQSTIEDPETINEVFRAAHSVKGGAAMLGVHSIQRIAHRFEDYFKILKDHPTRVDQKLESLMLQVFDALEELLDQLQESFGLSDDKANEVMAGVEPVFAQLDSHLQSVVSQSTPRTNTARIPVSVTEQTILQIPEGMGLPLEDSALRLVFQSDVPSSLREMLQLFKQPDNVESRQQLQEICHHLVSAGEQFDLPTWVKLVRAVRNAIAHRENTYRTLAPVAIKELKQAQDLVLTGRETEITLSDKLQELQPPEAVLVAERHSEFEEIEGLIPLGTDWATTLGEVSDPFSSTLDEMSLPLAEATPEPETSFDLFDLRPQPSISKRNEFNEQRSAPLGPEVGMAELNTLADLFEGEAPDLGLSWQSEEITGSGGEDLSLENLDDNEDFSDLLLTDTQPQSPMSDKTPAKSTEANNLLGEDLFAEEIGNSDETDLVDFLEIQGNMAAKTPNNNSNDANEFADLLDIAATVPPIPDLENENGLADLLEIAAIDESNSEELGLDEAIAFDGDDDAAELSDDLGDMFASLDEGDSDRQSESELSGFGDGDALNALFGEDSEALDDDSELDAENAASDIEDLELGFGSTTDDLDLDWSQTDNDSTAQLDEASDEFDLDLVETTSDTNSQLDEFDLDLGETSNDTTARLDEASDEFDLDLVETTSDTNSQLNEFDLDLGETSNDTTAQLDEASDEFDLDLVETTSDSTVQLDEFDLDLEETTSDSTAQLDEFDLDLEETSNDSTAQLDEAIDEFDLDLVETTSDSTVQLDEFDLDLEETSNDSTAQLDEASDEFDLDLVENPDDSTAQLDEVSDEFDLALGETSESPFEDLESSVENLEIGELTLTDSSNSTPAMSELDEWLGTPTEISTSQERSELVEDFFAIPEVPQSPAATKSAEIDNFWDEDFGVETSDESSSIESNLDLNFDSPEVELFDTEESSETNLEALSPLEDLEFGEEFDESSVPETEDLLEVEEVSVEVSVTTETEVEDDFFDTEASDEAAELDLLDLGADTENQLEAVSFGETSIQDAGFELVELVEEEEESLELITEEPVEAEFSFSEELDEGEPDFDLSHLDATESMTGANESFFDLETDSDSLEEPEGPDAIAETEEDTYQESEDIDDLFGSADSDSDLFDTVESMTGEDESLFDLETDSDSLEEPEELNAIAPSTEAEEDTFQESGDIDDLFGSADSVSELFDATESITDEDESLFALEIGSDNLEGPEGLDAIAETEEDTFQESGDIDDLFDSADSESELSDNLLDLAETSESESLLDLESPVEAADAGNNLFEFDATTDSTSETDSLLDLDTAEDSSEQSDNLFEFDATTDSTSETDSLLDLDTADVSDYLGESLFDTPELSSASNELLDLETDSTEASIEATNLFATDVADTEIPEADEMFSLASDDLEDLFGGDESESDASESLFIDSDTTANSSQTEDNLFDLDSFAEASSEADNLLDLDTTEDSSEQSDSLFEFDATADSTGEADNLLDLDIAEDSSEQSDSLFEFETTADSSSGTDNFVDFETADMSANFEFTESLTADLGESLFDTPEFSSPSNELFDLETDSTEASVETPDLFATDVADTEIPEADEMLSLASDDLEDLFSEPETELTEDATLDFEQPEATSDEPADSFLALNTDAEDNFSDDFNFDFGAEPSDDSADLLDFEATDTAESADNGLDFTDELVETPESEEDLLDFTDSADDLSWLSDITADIDDEPQGNMDLSLAFDTSATDASVDEWGDLNLETEFSQNAETATVDFDTLEALLGDADLKVTVSAADVQVFDQLEAFLDQPTTINPVPTAASVVVEPALAQLEVEEYSSLDNNLEDGEFDDLVALLEDADKSLGGPPTVSTSRRQAMPTQSRPRRTIEQNMRVPVKQLDNLSNLVGELVVNRNSLEQDQERLRQCLDNLLYQVQQLSDVGARMRDLYERSLLESALLSSRISNRFSNPSNEPDAGNHATGVKWEREEMDLFTPFHTLSQEMIELIVRVRESSSDIEFIVDETDQVTRQFRQITTQLQEGLTRARMVPFAQTADRLPGAVRRIAMDLKKQAEIVIEGRETLIDKMIQEQLFDPMTHLINNAMTHGIESPQERMRAGKSPVGKIMVRAFHQGNQTIISVSDDGAGINPERVKAKALEKRLITPEEAKTMTRLDVYDLLFRPGFSTKDQADNFSGRGVGMDVVRTSLRDIRGAINTDSTLGKGTTFTIRLPLTLSISKALCCISSRARIAFPMDGVEDMLDVPKERIQTNEEGQSCILWRDTLLPFQSLSELLQYNRQLSRGSVYGGHQEDDIISIVVLRSAGQYIALQVDQVLGEQEIVIKQLEGPVPKPIGIAGATVLGDGRIMPIADVLELIDLSMGRARRETNTLWEQESAVPIEAMQTKVEPTVLIVDDSITVRELLSMTFNKSGYRVEQARDGQDAWEKLRSGLPCDIVFCDIEMPRMDGLELLSRLQKDPSLSHLPVAMLTSRGAERHRQTAANLGAKGYFTKPYLEEALLEAASRMLKGEVLVTAKSS